MLSPTRDIRGSGQEDAFEVAASQANATCHGADRPARVVGLTVVGGEHRQPRRQPLEIRLTRRSARVVHPTSGMVR
jgi:hypothetical protein